MKKVRDGFILKLLKSIKNRWSMKILTAFLLIAILHPFIANERPVYCKIDGNTYFPIFRDIGVNLGFTDPYVDIVDTDWHEKEYEFRILPIVPYSYNTLDKENAQFIGPFEDQNIESWRYRHWLGTDILGRDVLAGLFKGAEIAVKVGFLSVFFALILGLILGLSSAYFYRFPLKMNIPTLILSVASIVIICYLLWLGSNIGFGKVVLPLLCLLILNVTQWFIDTRYSGNIKSKISIPINAIFIRLVEAMRTLPSMIFLLVFISIFETISIKTLIFILSFLMWPALSRYIRAEGIKVMEQDYITAAKAYGSSGLRILIRHVLPKLVVSLSVILTFSISSVILVEATLSFLGLGLPLEQVSWGGMLNDARRNFSAWWMAIFPGMALFLLILSLNELGEDLEGFS